MFDEKGTKQRDARYLTKQSEGPDYLDWVSTLLLSFHCYSRSCRTDYKNSPNSPADNEGEHTMPGNTLTLNR